MPSYTEQQAREAVRNSFSYAEALRKLGLRAVGGNHRTFRHWVDKVWEIPTDHFDPHRQFRQTQARFTPAKPLSEILVESSTYSRSNLKSRLFREGLKTEVCELCGQDDVWQGRHMALILDHVNGVGDDHRLENLRIVCPNCAATLDTHCGRKNRKTPTEKHCQLCGEIFVAWHPANIFCSRACGTRGAAANNSERLYGKPNMAARKVERPPFEQLVAEVRQTSWSAVGRKYGVSDNAVRKWVRQYYRERDRAEMELEREQTDSDAA